jgi:hypothetical protein
LSSDSNAQFQRDLNREIIGSNREQSLTNREVSPPTTPAASVAGSSLDPLYVDVIIRRYEAATGNVTVLVETFEALGMTSRDRCAIQPPFPDSPGTLK